MITAVIVTYNPDMEQIRKTVDSIIHQVSYCLIIDNGNARFEFQDITNIMIISLGKNHGIAYAQNRGIEQALKLNSEFIILSNQDTIFPDDYTEKNINAYQKLRGSNLAALVPVFFNVGGK
jgi:rhamnosyltransferase